MSLQIWLPLVEDLHNQGLYAPLTSNSQGAGVFVNDGKIGKAYHSTSNLVTNFYNTNNNNLVKMFEAGHGFSVAFWYKLKNTGSSAQLFQIGSTTNGTFGLWWTNTTSGSGPRFVWNDGNSGTSTGIYQSLGYSAPTDYDNWHHFVGVIDKTNQNQQIETFYLDGQLVRTATYNNSSAKQLDTSNSNNYFYLRSYFSYFNDFRIYDHCLSQKEVEEIAKGLVLHYPLNDDTTGGITNLLTKPMSLTTGEWNTWSSYNSNAAADRTVLSYITLDGYDVVEANAVRAPGRKVAPYKYMEIYEVGKTYTFSCLLRAKTAADVGKKVRFTCWNNDNQLDLNPNAGDNYTLTLNWQKVVGTFSFKATNPTPSKALNAYVGLDIASSSTNTEEVNYYCTRFMLEENNRASSVWVEGGQTLLNNIVYDCSGYSNNGTIVGSLTAAAPSPRYDVATDFSTGSISAPHFNYCNEGNLTISFWIYSADWSATSSSARSVITSYTSANNNYNGIRIYRSADATRLRLQYGAINTSTNEITYNANIYFHPNTVFDANTWHHFAVTLDSSSGVTLVKTFCDGEPYQEITNTSLLFKYINTSNSSILAPEPNEGCISDVRIYMTALTEDQVKELYNTSMSIDASGNVYARQLSDL